MKKLACYVSAIIIVAILASTQMALSWTVNASFDQNSNDTAMYTNNLSTDFSLTPPNSARFLIQKGIENTGQHGYSLPSQLNEGNELWIRIYLYPPTGFDWTAYPITKLLRVISANSDGTMWSYFSILATRPGSYGCSGENSYGYMLTGAEVHENENCQNRNTKTNVYFTPGKWHCIELYLKVSATNGVMRAWHNGILKQEYNISTIPTGGHIPAQRTSDWAVNHLLGWWNGGANQDQYIYFDNMKYTNEKPLNQDSEGNYMIGPINWSGSGTGSAPPSIPQDFIKN